MMRVFPLVLALGLAGCADEAPPAVNLADNGAPVMPAPRRTPDATGPGTALGLTYLELEDADLLDARGVEVAEVHEIDADAAGTVSGLRVKLKGPPTPGRTVRIGLEGLTRVPDGDEWDLRTTMTGDQLAALPTVTR
jgi:hypothetical protein